MHSPSATQVAAIRFDGVDFSYKKRTVLSGVSFQLFPGESAAIMGPSGAGKSTIFSLAAGFQRVASGSVSINGQDLTKPSSKRAAQIRATEVGIVFQAGHLLPELSAAENVALPAIANGLSYAEAVHRAEAILASLNLTENSTRPISQYSGGEQQRIAVARALINDPTLILADEPTGALDPDNRDSVVELLYSLPRERDKALLLVTHDPEVARHADRLFTLHDGALTITSQRATVASTIGAPRD